MSQHQPIPAGGAMVSMLVLLSGICIKSGYLTDVNWYKGLIITLPLLAIAIYKMRNAKKFPRPRREFRPPGRTQVLRRWEEIHHM